MFSLFLTAEVNAQIIPFEDIDFATWHRQSTSDGTGDGGALNAIDPLKTAAPNGSAMTLVDPLDPSTWTVTQSWQHDWQGQAGAFSSLSASTYTNLPWMIFDLGKPVPVDKMWVWNVSEGTGSDRGVRDFYIFYSSSPTVAVPNSVKAGTLPSSATDYDFFSGGWTQWGGIHTMTRGGGSYAFHTDFVVSNTVARYVGICPINNHGATESRGTGICTAVFSRLPPPEGTVIQLR